MDNDKNIHCEENENIETQESTEQEETSTDEQPQTEQTTIEAQIEELKAQLEKEKSSYLFLMAEFDNFRKRTIKEKGELLRNGAESAMKSLLPVVDDFERSLQAMNDTHDVEAVKEGVDLIYHKFIKYLEQNGVKAIESTNADFDTEYHEAVAMVPMGDEENKGKIIDTVSKGYTLNDKVIRHAKVAVAQ
ncbi:MAG: nucleotide exchange factor GrpE [Muribaculaceae bacterium]|nr:nucleotide exchange factor GrpE [Muribaculaceae bacterium]